MRILLTLALLAVAGPSGAETPVCEQLDRHDDIDIGLDVEIEHDELVVEIHGAERLRIDTQERVFVDGRELAIPAAARPTVSAYRAGFLDLEREALQIGAAGAKIGVDALAGLFRVLFTDETMDDYERRIEARGEAIEARAEALCTRVLDLSRLERELVAAVPGFPPVLTSEELHEI